MKRNFKIYLVLIAVVAMAVGCRSHKQLVDDGKERQPESRPTAEEQTKPQLDTIRNATYSRYCANFSCTVDGFALNGQIRMVHDSCIWISVNKIIEVGRVMITPTRVSGYSRIMGKYYDGSYEDVRKRWGVDIDYGTMEALLVGNCPPNCIRSKEPQREGDEVTLWYSQKGHSQRKVTLHKEYSSRLLNATEVNNTAPAAQVRCAYRERAEQNGQMLPTVIDASVSLRNMTKQTRLTLSRITLNQKQNTPFEIPAKLEKL